MGIIRGKQTKMEEENNSNYNITTPPSIILKIMILERRQELINSIEEYNNKKFLGAGWPINKIKALLYSLSYEIDAGLRKEYDKAKKGEENLYKTFKDKLKSKDADTLIEAFDFIEDYFYKKNLTRWDLKQQYDNSNVELENYYKGT